MDEQPEAIRVLFADIRRIRRCGQVVLEYWPVEEPFSPLPAALDEVLEMSGLNGAYSDCLQPLTRLQAGSALLYLLTHDLAYSVEFATGSEASPLVTSFLSQFPDPAEFFTNGTSSFGTGNSSWTPLTSATFDSGIIAVTSEAIGVVWFADED